MGNNNTAPRDMIAPSGSAVAITASATAFDACRGIHCNVSGTLTVQFENGASTVDIVVVSGAFYPYRLVKVTVGTGVLALY